MATFSLQINTDGDAFRDTSLEERDAALAETGDILSRLGEYLRMAVGFQVKGEGRLYDSNGIHVGAYSLDGLGEPEEESEWR